MHKNAS